MSRRTSLARIAIVVVVAFTAFVGRAQQQGGTTNLAGLRPVAQPKLLRLDDAFVQAATRSYDLRIARARVAESEARVRQAWSALLPRLSLEGNYTFNTPEQTAAFGSEEQLQQQALLFNSIADITEQSAALNPNPLAQRAAVERAEQLRKAATDLQNQKVAEIVIQPAHVVGGNLSLALPLFNARSVPLLQNAYSGVEISKLATSQARAGVLFGVARAYYGVVATKKVVEIARGQLESATRHRELAQRRKELGLMTELAMQRAELDVARAEQQVRSAEGGMRSAKGALAGLLGLVDDFDVEEPPAMQAIEGGASVDDMLQRAASHRIDLRVQRESLALADRAVADAWLRLLPSFSLVAQGRYTSNTSGFISDPFTGAVIVQGSLPIFDGGQTLGVIDESNAQLQQQLLRVRQVEDLVEREVRGTVDDLALKRDAVGTAERVAELSDKQAQNAEQLFEAGAATQNDVSDAQLGAFAARVDAARARFDLEVARLGLSYALGEMSLAAQAEAAPLSSDEATSARKALDAASAQ